MSLFAVRDIDQVLFDWLELVDLLGLSRVNRYYWQTISSSRPYLQAKIIQLKHPTNPFYWAIKHGYTKAALYFWRQRQYPGPDLSYICNHVQLDLFVFLSGQAPDHFNLKTCLWEACESNSVDVIQHLLRLYSAEQPDLDLLPYFRRAAQFGRRDVAQLFYDLIEQRQGVPLTRSHPELLKQMLGNPVIHHEFISWLLQITQADWPTDQWDQAIRAAFSQVRRSSYDKPDEYRCFYEAGWIPPNEPNYVKYCWVNQKVDELDSYLTQWPRLAQDFFSFPESRFREAYRAQHVDLVHLVYRRFPALCRGLLEIKILRARLKGTLSTKMWMIDLYNS